MSTILLVSLTSACFRNISIPTGRTFRVSQVPLHVSRWLRFTAMLFALLGAAERIMAQIYVTTTLEDNSDPSNCSLREAIYAAEFGGSIAIGSTDPDTTYNTGCTDGSGTWNNIVLQTGSTYQFTRFWDGDAHNPFGPTATPIIFKTISIEGNGATLVWDGAGNSRLFAVGYASVTVNGTTYSGTGNLTLRHVYVKNFHVQGGDGGCNGGGGLGAGGAIYLGRVPGSGAPGLAIENSTFEFNGATGGNGGGICNSVAAASGGGGGLSGKGVGAGGSGGGGGGGGVRGNGGLPDSGGGGGGGTVFNGGNSSGNTGGASGDLCGGNGGDADNDGRDGQCAGGGGGGGGVPDPNALVSHGGGGKGAYGGGGGGAGDDSFFTLEGFNGGDGGFGGGGGGGSENNGHGGNGGFGGGGGAGALAVVFDTTGKGGSFGGNGISQTGGGGGGALGGAIFNDSGNLTVQNSTFFNNYVDHGLGGSFVGVNGGIVYADPGADAGGAIFSRNGSTTIQDATISGNQATGSGAGVEVMSDGDSATATFVLENTIIAGNNGNRECIVSGSVGTDGSTSNLIVNDSGCPNVVITSDPMLDSLKPNVPGDTPTMALLSGSPAIGAADSNLNVALPTDQRGIPRKDSPDIGAYESVPLADLSLTKTVSPSTAKAGDTVTYTLNLNNLGPDVANNVALADFLPAALTFVSCTASGGAACSSQGGFLVVGYGTLAANDPQTITIKGTLNAGASRGTVMNQASVSGASPLDPDPNNNSSSASFAVLVPDFSVNAASPITLVVGASGTSLVTVGSIDTFSSAVKLTAPEPSGFQGSFSSNPVTPPSNGSKSSTLTISLGPSVTAGSYTVSVTGTSGALTHTTSVTVTVQATIAGIKNVIGSFLTSGAIDIPGIANALTSKLSTAQNYVSAGDNQTAVNVLSALINQLNAQSGRHISASAASVLITDTQALQTSLGANLRPDPVMGYVVSSSNVPIPGATISVRDPSNLVVAMTTADSTGLYFFPLTRGWTLGWAYTVKVTLPKGYKASNPASEEFNWQATQVTISNFVLN